MSLLSQLLSERYGIPNAILTSRASSAIYTVLAALNSSSKKVLVPAVTCPAAVFPILAAGYDPVFVDIQLDDFNLDPAALSKLDPKDYGALLAVHSFGHRMDLDPLKTWCDRSNIFLIEDACQLMGDENFDPKGDALILSFGHTKPLDVGSGGALLIRDSALAAECQNIERHLPHIETVQDLDEAYRSDYYATRTPTQRCELPQLGMKYEALYVHRLEDSESLESQVLKELPEFPDRMHTRQIRFEKFAEAFDSLPLRFPNLLSGSIPWRFTCLTQTAEEQRELTKQLREAGFHASNWYPSLPLDWGERPDFHPNASLFEKCVLNLWLAEGTSENDLERTCQFIQSYFR